MRVIAGSARGRRLQGPPDGAPTRPTSDKVRQALFNIIGASVTGARVLDLFSGTGALSIEALSRGAASAVLVDCDGGLCALARKNLDTSGVADRAKVVCRDVRRAATLFTAGEFDIVLIDPPYGNALERDALAVLDQAGALAADPFVVVEHARKQPPVLPPGWTVTRCYDYGDTSLSLVAREEPAASGESA